MVDNGSTDGSWEYLQSEWSAKVRLLRNERNLGFTPGVNAGIRHSTSDWIALLNTDAVADRDWLQCMVKEAGDRPEIGMCACKILSATEKGRIDKVGHLLYADGLNGGRGFGQIDRGQYDGTEEVLFPDGCAAMYRRSLFEEIGLFDEQFFAYGDDAELGLRARWFGWKCLYVPGAVVHHSHSVSLGKSSPVKAMLVERNRIWLACKLFPWWLLLLNPYWTLWRYSWHVWSVLHGTGSAGNMVREKSIPVLAKALCKAHISAWRGMPAVWRQRRWIRKNRKIGDREFLALIRRFRISARELALCDR